MKNKNVAIVFDDLTEFFVMRDAIDAMLKEKIPVDIIVPYDSGYNGLAEHTYNKIKEFGYSPKKDAPKNKTYKILLTPYPHLNIVKRIKFFYHIQYYYGSVSTKPTPTYEIDWKIDYDAVISFNTYESNFLSAYGAKYYSVPYWKYENFKKTTKSISKPNLLILPTFGADASCIQSLTKELIKELKQHFHIVIKAHHATHFSIDGDASFQQIKALADKFYDSDISIVDLLSSADLVLSDNSSSVFEAIYAEIPVAIFAKNINSRRLGNINTLQYRLVQEDIIPYTNNPDHLLETLLSTKNYTKKQKDLKDKIFVPIKKNSVREFVNIIESYLNKDSQEDYHKTIHDLMLNERRRHIEQIESLCKTRDQYLSSIQDLEKTISDQNKIIKDIYNSTSWKITKPLRRLKNK